MLTLLQLDEGRHWVPEQYLIVAVINRAIMDLLWPTRMTTRTERMEAKDFVFGGEMEALITDTLSLDADVAKRMTDKIKGFYGKLEGPKPVRKTAKIPYRGVWHRSSSLPGGSGLEDLFRALRELDPIS